MRELNLCKARYRKCIQAALKKLAEIKAAGKPKPSFQEQIQNGMAILFFIAALGFFSYVYLWEPLRNPRLTNAELLLAYWRQHLAGFICALIVTWLRRRK